MVAPPSKTEGISAVLLGVRIGAWEGVAGFDSMGRTGEGVGTTGAALTTGAGAGGVIGAGVGTTTGATLTGSAGTGGAITGGGGTTTGAALTGSAGAGGVEGMGGGIGARAVTGGGGSTAVLRAGAVVPDEMAGAGGKTGGGVFG